MKKGPLSSREKGSCLDVRRVVCTFVDRLIRNNTTKSDHLHELPAPGPEFGLGARPQVPKLKAPVAATTARPSDGTTRTFIDAAALWMGAWVSLPTH